jgi:hypothetical protein
MTTNEISQFKSKSINSFSNAYSYVEVILNAYKII